MSSTVCVSIVTLNHERWLGACLETVLKQSVDVRVTVFDNGSSDGSLQTAHRFPVRVVASAENVGFSAAHNRNILGDDSPYILVLNPDVVLDRFFLENLLTALREVKDGGMAGGKLHRLGSTATVETRDRCPIIDSTGIYFTRTQRHFDRGSQEPDRGQYDKRELVFGITGAALLCTREMLEDIRDGDEIFDEDFFAYREDADLAWRAQLRGWKAVYEPGARALHRRAVLPANRREIAELINFHSVKNRYLMRIKNMDRAVRRRCFPYMWLRDAGIRMYALVQERSSLPAFDEVRRLRPRFEKKRQFVQGRRKAGPDEIARWFAFRPVSYEVKRT